MDLGFKLAVSNRNLKHPTSRQIFGDTSGLLCKNDQILRLNNTAVRYILLQYVYCCCLMLVWVSPSFCECDGRSDLRVAWQHDCSLHLSLSGRLYNAQGCPVICFISFHLVWSILPRNIRWLSINVIAQFHCRRSQLTHSNTELFLVGLGDAQMWAQSCGGWDVVPCARSRSLSNDWIQKLKLGLTEIYLMVG